MGICLGGTVAGPAVWWHDDKRHDGRVCKREKDYTGKRFCGSCIAYRGQDRFGQYHGALQDGTEPGELLIRNLTEREHRDYVAAVQAASENDDWRPLQALARRLGHRGLSTMAKYRVLDEEEDRQAWAERTAAWRAAHPERAREQNRRAAARYRARKRVSIPSLRARPGPGCDEGSHGLAPARARREGILTEKSHAAAT